MRVEVRRVTMIVARLLKIDAVGKNMTIKLFQQNASSGCAPDLRAAQLRQQRAQIKESQGFARQMRIRAEVGGEIRLQVARVKV
jgi:cytoskeletal protein CcmA (bactofilin family)